MIARVVPLSRKPPRDGTWLGLDLGGTKVALRAETDTGVVREHVFRWHGRGLESDLAQLAAEVELFRQQVPDGFAGVGVALPAAVGTDGLVTAWPNRPEWLGLNARRTFHALFGDIPVGWADDGALGALAEARASGCDDVLLYVGVGTGVGGGLVVDGVLWPGPDRGSFEIGHLVTDADGPKCRCGRRGCLQATASGPATLARAARLRGADVGYDELQQGLLADEEWAVQSVDRSCHRLAVAITGVRELLHPSLVVVGGGFAAGLPCFADTVARHMATQARPGVPAPVVTSSLMGGNSTLHGAVALAHMLGQNSH
ncbi:kanosamine kinase [Longispora fulva]|uniref:Kanosamine 6-kinase n=1 Tax=Longispora fulva TaxID=619741 RepID=A0A8J7KPQ0_9ACTN|nr:ROK family protein [Longispora fulva]MBG6141561.1 kanosamine 6-kinase [Longispora fulva]GIG59286.1 kanosamine kinase [Longispora fulva]